MSGRCPTVIPWPYIRLQFTGQSSLMNKFSCPPAVYSALSAPAPSSSTPLSPCLLPGTTIPLISMLSSRSTDYSFSLKPLCDLALVINLEATRKIRAHLQEEKLLRGRHLPQSRSLLVSKQAELLSLIKRVGRVLLLPAQSICRNLGVQDSQAYPLKYPHDRSQSPSHLTFAQGTSHGYRFHPLCSSATHKIQSWAKIFCGHQGW